MLERYYKIARNNVRTANPFVELDREQFMDDLEYNACEEIYSEYQKQDKDIDPYWYDIETKDLMEEYIEKAFTECEYWIDENTPGYITGGVEIGDYTYHYIRTNDDEDHFITMADIGRRN